MAKQTSALPKPAPKPSGSFGAPPAGAPHETSQPLSSEVLQAQVEKALANEKVLAPLVFQKGEPIGPKQATLPPVPEADLTGKPAGGGDPDPPYHPEPGPLEPVAPHQPAASNTDSPSRGIPHPILDPGKRITGGFGQAESQYYALDGTEIKEIIRGLMDLLNERLDPDLRFSIAITYPRVRIRVGLVVDGLDPTAEITGHPFDLTESRLVSLVATREDNEETPADALRDEVRLAKPYKHTVGTGERKMFVDVEV